MKPWEKYQTQETESAPWEKYGGQETQQSVATPDQYLTTKERFHTGFKLDPVKAVEEEVAKRGLAPGTPLEPTWGKDSVMDNIKDIIPDILDIVGPSIPAVSSTVASILSTPVGAVTGGIGTVAAASLAAGAGEVARQSFGAMMFDEKDAEMRDRLLRVGGEVALAGIGEGIGIGAIQLFNKGAKG